MKKIQKLSLNKVIVSNLTSEEANHLLGGGTGMGCQHSYGTYCETNHCPQTNAGEYSCNDCPDSDNCVSVVPAYC